MRHVSFWDGVQVGVGIMGLLFGLFILVEGFDGGIVLLCISAANIPMGIFIPFRRKSEDDQHERTESGNTPAESGVNGANVPRGE